jgi:hypothetical protein
MIPAWLQKLLAAIEAFLNRLLGRQVPSSIQVEVSKGNPPMAKKVTNVTAYLYPKGHAKRGVQQDVQLTAETNTLTIITLDQFGKPMNPPIAAAAVTTTLTGSDSTQMTFASGPDSLHWTDTVLPNATSRVVVNVTETFLDGSVGPFSATLGLLPPVPPAQVPTDIAVVIS